MWTPGLGSQRMTHKISLSTFGQTLRRDYEVNEHGRDFVVGDIHGSFQLFQKALNSLDFDFNKDRMFFVGDLCDRGMDSFEVLRAVKHGHGRWAEPVAGNHEMMFVDWMDNSAKGYGYYFIRNGGDWVHQHAGDPLLKEVAQWICTLPRFITVKKKDGGQVHIIHAELGNCGNGPITDAMLADDDQLWKMVMIWAKDGEVSFWGRRVFGYFKDSYRESYMTREIQEQIVNTWFSDDLSMIISGHTILDRPTKVGKLYGIDTGAYAQDGAMTIYSITDDVTYQVNSNEPGIKVVQPYVWVPNIMKGN